jgi:hypothetical protein
MELLKKAFFENVDTVVATKFEVAYLKESVLVFNSGKKIAAPPKPYITVEAGDNNRVYVKSNSNLFRLTGDGFESVCDENSEFFLIVDEEKHIRISAEGHEGTDSLYHKDTLVWSVSEEKGMPIYRGNTLVTFPDFKHKTLHFREMDTFEIKKEISATEPFEFIRNSHHVFDDQVIFFQYQKKRDTSKMQQVIATCCDLDSGKILWETAFQGSHRYILNDADGNLYALFGRHEPGGKTLYLNCLNTSTGQVTLDIVEKNTVVASVPWLAQIYKNVMYISDIYTEGCVIWAFDLTTKKILTHFNLGLDKGTSLKAPVIRNDEMYVLDSTETLHVFDIVY